MNDINITNFFNKYYTKTKNARIIIIIKVNIYYEDLFFVTITITIIIKI